MDQTSEVVGQYFESVSVRSEERHDILSSVTLLFYKNTPTALSVCVEGAQHKSDSAPESCLSVKYRCPLNHNMLPLVRFLRILWVNKHALVSAGGHSVQIQSLFDRASQLSPELCPRPEAGQWSRREEPGAMAASSSPPLEERSRAVRISHVQ